MTDTETMGTRPGSAIVSLGAQMFDPDTGCLGAQFYETITIASCIQAGLRIEAGALIWWLQQSAAARAEIVNANKSITQVLSSFLTFWKDNKAKFFWSHGAGFDEPIIQAGFIVTKLSCPWNYGEVRDTRTIYDLAAIKPTRSEDTHHHALHDAISQAIAVIDSYRKLHDWQPTTLADFR